MASKKGSKSRQSIKDLSPRERQAKGVKGGRVATSVTAAETMLKAPVRETMIKETTVSTRSRI